MFKLLVLILIVMNLAVQVDGQNSYTVVYRQLNYVDSNGRNPTSELKGALFIMNDSMTVYRLSRKEKELMTKFDLSCSDAHHGTINHLKGGYYYDIVHLKDEDLYIKVPTDTTKWIIDSNNSVTILNIKCFAAKSAEAVVWFAPSMPLKAGPMNYFGLPGLVLAVYNNRFHFVYLAKKILTTIPEIVASKQTSIVTLEQFRELQKKRVFIKDNQLEIRKFQSY